MTHAEEHRGDPAAELVEVIEAQAREIERLRRCGSRETINGAPCERERFHDGPHMTPSTW